MITRLIILVLLLIACGSSHDHPSVPTNSSSIDELGSQYDQYIVLNHAFLDRHGWDTVDCDGLLFSSLSSVGRDSEIDLTSATDSPGHWFRRPLDDYSVCTPNTISRDMLTGLMVYIVHFHRADLIKQLWDYGDAHDWKMGDGDIRTVLTPGFPAWIAQVLLQFTGEVHSERNIPDVYIYSSSSGQWFGNHLLMLHILANGILDGGIPSPQLAFLHRVMSDNPGNILASILYHKFTDGNQEENILELKKFYPQNRLPTGHEQCGNWRWQYSDGDYNLGSCDQYDPNIDRARNGADFLFAAAIILGKI